MAVSSSSPDTIGIPNLAGVIISTYAEESRPILTLLVIYVALGAMCLPLLLAVFYFSTPRIRRTPLFMIIVFDIFLGVGMSCWMATCTFKFLLKPLGGFPRTSFLAIPFITFTGPWVIDLVLLLRLYAVFPLATTRWRTSCSIFGIAACIKAARLGCGIATAVQWVPTVGQNPLASAYSSDDIHFMHSALLKVALTCDLIDHLFVATCFLRKIRVVSFGRRVISPKDAATGSLIHRLRVVFYIALGNFVLPIIFNILILLLVCIQSIDIMIVNYLGPINMYINIFGIVFATIWSSGHAPAVNPTVPVNVCPRVYPLRACGTNRTLAVEATYEEGVDKVGEYVTST